MPKKFAPPAWMQAPFDCPDCKQPVFVHLNMPRAHVDIIVCSDCPWEADLKPAQTAARKMARLARERSADLEANQSVLRSLESSDQPDPDPQTDPLRAA